MAVGYLVYANATAIPGRIDGRLVLVALLLAPVALAALGWVSGTARVGRRVGQAIGALVLVALPLGLIAPALGAAAGYGAGVALVLNPPPFPGVLRHRLVAVAAAAAYTLLLLVVITPAGVLTGALLPPLVVGIADEYSAWADGRRRH